MSLKNTLEKSKLLKHISIVFAWDNIAKFIGVVTTIICVRLLSKEDYAFYTLFLSASMFFVGVVSSGIDMAYVRFSAEEYSFKKKMPNDIFVFSLVFCFTIFIFLLPFVLVFNEKLSVLMFRNSSYGQAICLGFVSAMGLFLITMISRYYQVQEKYSLAGIFISLQKLLFFIGILFMFIVQQITFLTIAYLQIVVILFFGVGAVFVLRNDLLCEELCLNYTRFKNFFKASFWLIMYFLCLALFGQLDIFMISRLMTVDALAEYGVAVKYYGFLMLMFPSIKTVLKVRTSKIDMVESIEKQREFFKKWIKVSSFFLLPCIIVLFFLSDRVMTLLNGTEYIKSILPFKILSVSAMCSYVFSPSVDIFRAMRKYFLLFCFGVITLFANFFGNLVLIPIYGIIGAAFATFISYFIVNGLATIYVLFRE